MRLLWTDPAVQDLTSICDYLKEHGSPELSSRIALSLDELHLYGALVDGAHMLIEPVEPLELLAAVEDAVAHPTLSATG